MVDPYQIPKEFFDATEMGVSRPGRMRRTNEDPIMHMAFLNLVKAVHALFDQEAFKPSQRKRIVGFAVAEGSSVLNEFLNEWLEKSLSRHSRSP